MRVDASQNQSSHACFLARSLRKVHFIAMLRAISEQTLFRACFCLSKSHSFVRSFIGGASRAIIFLVSCWFLFGFFFQAISDVVGFKFRLYTVPDNLYGVYNHETAEWNGIVRQLTDKRADLAVASMTINYARETVIDFTKPFMNLGISILFKAPKDPATEVSDLLFH